MGRHASSEFSPDFFIKTGDFVFVVEIKGDEELKDPAPENEKKHEYASDHFDRLNKWLEKKGTQTRYQFQYVEPKGF
jgi:type III restriction enzyme